jgi:hypothetical protein
MHPRHLATAPRLSLVTRPGKERKNEEAWGRKEKNVRGEKKEERKKENREKTK